MQPQTQVIKPGRRKNKTSNPVIIYLHEQTIRILQGLAKGGDCELISQCGGIAR